jgi:hypothetical protein
MRKRPAGVWPIPLFCFSQTLLYTNVLAILSLHFGEIGVYWMPLVYVLFLLCHMTFLKEDAENPSRV